MMTWIVIALAVVGHLALHLVIYNRLNATGLRRRTIKRIVKFFMLTCVALPGLLVYQLIQDGTLMDTQAYQSLHLSQLPIWSRLYGLVCLATLLIYGPAWLRYRPLWHPDRAPVVREATRRDARRELASPLALTRKCRWQAKIPINQLFHLSVDRLELTVPGLPAALDGMKLAHLSDLHLTGHIAPDYSRWVMDQALQWQPDLIALTGDIVDKQDCIEWLPGILGHATAPAGCYFLLGNHDTRVPEPIQIREQMKRCGWMDVGGKSCLVSIRGVEIELIGNERPWFAGPQLSPSSAEGRFRLLLSHSPDQISWAQSHQVGLMLAGHTHGGQGRLPLVGPVLSPSWYGSRFASGEFFLAPTTMHVSRGLGGVHLYRIHCPPELSLITLRARE